MNFKWKENCVTMLRNLNFKKDDIISQVVTSETSPWLASVMKMALSQGLRVRNMIHIWKKEKLKTKNKSPCHSKGCIKIGKKTAGSWSCVLLTILWFLHTSSSALSLCHRWCWDIVFLLCSHLPFHLCHLRLFCGHYFIRSMAKLPLLTDNRIIQKVLFPVPI